MSNRTRLLAVMITLLALVLGPMTLLAQEATEEPMTGAGGRVLTETETAIAEAIAACPTDQALTIAVSTPGNQFPFFVHMVSQLQAEAEAIGNIEVVVYDAEDDPVKQASDVESMILEGVDAIVISPRDVDALAPALQEAVDAGIPVVTIDRRVENVEGLLAHVGAENVLGGEAQGNWVLENYPDGAEIIVLLGTPGAGPAIDRAAGQHNVLDPVADMYPIVAEQTANFNLDQGASVTSAILAGLPNPPDVIVAANDDMARGAMVAVEDAGLTGEVAILGFDALPEALAAVNEGTLAGTVEQFPGGQSATALRVAVNHARGCGEPPEAVIFLTPVLITSDNFAMAERLGEVEGLEMATEEASS